MTCLEGRSSTIELRPHGLCNTTILLKKRNLQGIDFATVRQNWSENGVTAVKSAVKTAVKTAVKNDPFLMASQCSVDLVLYLGLSVCQGLVIL